MSVGAAPPPKLPLTNTALVAAPTMLKNNV